MLPPEDKHVIPPLLLEGHRRILEAADDNERQLSGPRPECFAALAATRWAFTRALLTHFAHNEATALRPLIADQRAHVAAEARRSLAEQTQLLDDFKDHVRTWGSLAGEAQWPDYVRATKALMQRIRRRLQSEELGLYLFLPVQPGAAMPDAPSHHCEDARAIGAVIFKGEALA